jgi:hypothetical protein
MQEKHLGSDHFVAARADQETEKVSEINNLRTLDGARTLVFPAQNTHNPLYSL